MKTIFVLVVSAITFISLSSFTISKWEKLGQTTVNYKIDRDEIHVGIKDGVFSKLSLSVKKAPVEFYKVIVHFRNGESQVLKIKELVGPGSRTRVIDLKGKKRIIKKVVFFYDTKGHYKKAKVTLWGR